MLWDAVIKKPFNNLTGKQTYSNIGLNLDSMNTDAIFNIVKGKKDGIS